MKEFYNEQLGEFYWDSILEIWLGSVSSNVVNSTCSLNKTIDLAVENKEAVGQLCQFIERLDDWLTPLFPEIETVFNQLLKAQQSERTPLQSIQEKISLEEISFYKDKYQVVFGTDGRLDRCLIIAEVPWDKQEVSVYLAG